MESLNRLLNTCHLLQGKIIALLGDNDPDQTDITAIGEMLEQCRNQYEDYFADMKGKKSVSQDDRELMDDPNRTVLIGDDEEIESDPNRTYIIEREEDCGNTNIQQDTTEVIDNQESNVALDAEAPICQTGELHDLPEAPSETAEDNQTQSIQENVGSEISATAEVESDQYISLDDLSAISDSDNVIRLDDTLSSRATANDVRRAFTLNDKYRFRRELFGNSDVALNDALDMVSTMRSIDEVRDYLATDLDWDLENEDVKDFIDILAARFK